LEKKRERVGVKWRRRREEEKVGIGQDMDLLPTLYEERQNTCTSLYPCFQCSIFLFF